jgi:tripartite-type tricarboxylate transporter receptor subunit TctC
VAAALWATLAGFCATMPVHAQDTYPNRPIALVLPYPGGGPNDLLGRLIGQKLAESLGQQVIIENKPGAGTLIGATAAAKAAPDGYTLFLGGLASFATGPVLVKADYDPVKDFAAVGLICTARTVLITYNEAPYRTVRDVVEAAKQEPGAIMYGSSGNGTALHLAGEIFAIDTGTQMTHIPYKGGSAHILDLVGGRLHVIFAPARTPPAILAKLSAELAKALKQPDVQEKLRRIGASPSDGDPQELARLIPAEHDKYSKLIKTLNLKAY